MRKARQLSVSVGDFNQDNEFMQGSKKVGVSSSRPTISKDEKIQRLEQRNVKLQQEVIRIERALSGIEDKTTYGIHLPSIKSDVIHKEIQNAYKQIKQYQYEIAKRKKMDLEGAYVDHLRKYEKTLREKMQISDKLRKDILQTKKQTNEYAKMLKDDTLKKQNCQKERKINADIKWLHEKIKKQQQKKNQLNMNLQKEQQLVQKIQKDLLQLNYSKTFMQNLRNKFLTPQVPTNVDEEQDDEELQPLQARGIDLDDRSPEIYEVLMGEIRLYRKLDNDYEQKISLLSRQKEQSEERNMTSRNKLLQVQYEIEKVEARIAELKTQLDPKAMIPTHIDALREEARRFNSVKKINKPKITMAHLFRFAQLGEATKDGKRFIDRNAIGKKTAKIIAVTYFQSKDDQRLLGLQATYLIGKTKKQGLKNLLCNADKIEERHFQVEQGDYVKTIDCLQNEKGLIVGMAMVSARNQILRGGIQTDSRKSIDLTPTEVPVCLYGSLLQNGVEMLGSEALPAE